MTGPLQENFKRRSVFSLVVVGSLAVLLAGCVGKPFDVKTQVTLPALAGAPLVESRGIRLQAAAVRDEDYLVATFDANLIMAGILPVNVTIANQTAQPLDLHKARFELRGSEGKAYHAADAKHTFKRLINYYEISTYTKAAYKHSQEDFAAYALDTARPLAMGESRQGMLFFIVPDGVIRATGFKLIVTRLDATPSADAVELRLD
jgi:hypothetical protein